MDQDDQRSLNKLRCMLETVDLTNTEKREEFFNDFYTLIKDWDGELPNLRDFFTKKEMELLIIYMIGKISTRAFNNEVVFFDFLSDADYKDEADVDEDGRVSSRRTTPLHHPFRCDQNWIVQSLFDVYDNYEVNYSNEQGLTHFHVACKTVDCRDVVDKFLKSGHSPDLRAKETGDAPLHFALRHSNWGAAESLLKNGADPNLANEKGSTPIHVCYEYHCLLKFFQLMEEFGKPVKIDARDNDGNTPLHLAVLRTNKSSMELLMAKGADPNAANAAGLAPLHTLCVNYATSMGDVSNAERFRRTKLAYISTLLPYNDDELFRTVLELAAKSECPPLRLDARDKLGRTPLQYAVTNLLPDLVGVLLDRGADLSGFVFPSAADFVRASRHWLKRNHFKLRIAAGLMGVVEQLEKRGYELDLGDVLMIMELFDKYALLQRTADHVTRRRRGRCWFDDEAFASRAKSVAVIGDLSLYQLVLLRPEQAAQRLEFSDYLSFAITEEYLELSNNDPLAVHLCEKLARGFFLDWGLELYSLLTDHRMPFDCTRMILKKLTNKDLWRICTAASSSRARTDSWVRSLNYLSLENNV